jgi:hypothetical protein
MTSQPRKARSFSDLPTPDAGAVKATYTVNQTVPALGAKPHVARVGAPGEIEAGGWPLTRTDTTAHSSRAIDCPPQSFDGTTVLYTP